MNSPKLVAVDAQELRNSFEFVTAGNPYDHKAWICLDTGKIYWQTEGLSDEDIPDDIEDNDRYLAVPDQLQLNLGRRLGLKFAAEELPEDYNTVADFFRRRGAYGRFKTFLQERNLLARWYDFENRATDEALLAWCAENGLVPTTNKPDP